MDAAVDSLHSLDWEDINAVEHATRKVFQTLLDEPTIVRDALLALPERPELLRLCEHYDILDKLVLYNGDSGIRVRLHVFLPGYFDRPHNHRWSYASTILRGEYRHYLFGDAELNDQADPASLKTLMARQEHVGSTYALHHTMVHAVVAEPYTVSLVIRGPAVKDRFLVMDRRTGESWWQHGAGLESADSAAAKSMRIERLRELMGLLDTWNLL